MIGRVVEIANNNRHLSLFRGFLIIQNKPKMDELARIPLDDILAVIAHAYGITYTNNILVELANRNIPFVLCNEFHEPVGVLWPLDGHHLQGRRIDAQIEATLPKKKQLWAKVVQCKITQQALVLEYFGIDARKLLRMAKEVKSGDSENKEGQAARLYWSELFEDNFSRNRTLPGINAFLNYGYTIIRSAMSRAIIAAGLHPSIGLHHCNDANPMRLADDLMEPYRPIVDATIKELTLKQPELNDSECITPEIKKLLVKCLFFDTENTDGTNSPVMVSMQNLATSLAQFFLKERNSLILPERFVYGINSQTDEDE